MKKVKVTSIKGYKQDENFYPQFCELEITDIMFKNMPDIFSVIVPEGEKVKPIRVKKVKRESAEDPVKTKDEPEKAPESVVEKPVVVRGEKALEKKPPVEKAEYPHLIGGSWYRLSNKKKVQGKAKAFAAEKALE